MKDIMTDAEFFELCILNRELKFERTSSGQVILEEPTGGYTGILNSKLSARLQLWAEGDGTGFAFDSSTAFVLPNGATRSPDAAWLSNEKWSPLSEKAKMKFPPLCPDFVVEIRSETDSYMAVKNKMEEYVANGCRLAWLIDPKAKTLEIFNGDTRPELITRFTQTITGEPVLKGFQLDLTVLNE